MSTIYVIALAAVGLALLATTLSAVISVMRRPEWQQPRARPTWELVKTEDRRREALPFVGQDRRRAAPGEAAEATDRLAA